jgi:hypothetical protein
MEIVLYFFHLPTVSVCSIWIDGKDFSLIQEFGLSINNPMAPNGVYIVFKGLSINTLTIKA